MTNHSLVHRLRNTPVRLLIRALEKDGFTYRRRPGSGRLYRHADGRRVVIHYHKGSETLREEGGSPRVTRARLQLVYQRI